VAGAIWTPVTWSSIVISRQGAIDVRFGADYGLKSDIAPSPLGATSGHTSHPVDAYTLSMLMSGCLGAREVAGLGFWARLRFRLLQVEAHVHLAVHRCRGGEMHARLFLLADTLI
jgi:hypothetical protein